MLGAKLHMLPLDLIKKVLLVTHDTSSIGQMSCNPAIGGLGQKSSGERNRCYGRTNGGLCRQSRYSF